MTKNTIDSITLTGKENSDLFKLINELADLRPAHAPTALVREILLDTIPAKIKELKRNKQSG